MASTLPSTTSSTIALEQNTKWLKQCHSRLKINAQLESIKTKNYFFGKDEKFVQGLPIPSVRMLSNDMKNKEVMGFRVYLNMTGNKQTILEQIKLELAATDLTATECTLFFLDLLQELPEIQPLTLSQYFLESSPYMKYWSQDRKYWKTINDFNAAHSLTPDNIMNGLTLEQVKAINSDSARHMGITAEKISSVKATLKSQAKAEMGMKTNHDCLLL